MCREPPCQRPNLIKLIRPADKIINDTTTFIVNVYSTFRILIYSCVIISFDDVLWMIKNSMFPMKFNLFDL